MYTKRGLNVQAPFRILLQWKRGLKSDSIQATKGEILSSSRQFTHPRPPVSVAWIPLRKSINPFRSFSLKLVRCLSDYRPFFHSTGIKKGLKSFCSSSCFSHNSFSIWLVSSLIFMNFHEELINFNQAVNQEEGFKVGYSQLPKPNQNLHNELNTYQLKNYKPE